MDEKPFKYTKHQQQKLTKIPSKSLLFRMLKNTAVNCQLRLIKKSLTLLLKSGKEFDDFAEVGSTLPHRLYTLNEIADFNATLGGLFTF